jgi:hypothetical protein
LPTVDRVLNVLPQLHVTSISAYLGWMASFMAFLVGARKEIMALPGAGALLAG